MKHELAQLQAQWDAEAEAQARADLVASSEHRSRAQRLAEDLTLLLLGALLGLAILGMLR